MKFRRTAFSTRPVTAILALLAIAGQAAAAENLTLDKALELSRQANPLVLAAEARVRQEEGRLVQLKSDQLPQAYATLGYQGLDEAPGTYALAPDGKTPIGIVPLGFEDTYQAAVNLTQVLYSGGSLSARTESGKLLVAARKSELDRTLQSVENGVGKAYYGLQQALSRLEVAREALDLSREHLRQVDSFYRAGVIAQNEVLRVQVAVSSSTLDLIRAESAVKVAWKSLERIVGQTLEGRYAVARGDFALEPFPLPGDPAGRALGQRPELRGLDAARKAALMTVKAVKGQALPQVALAAQAYVADDDFFPSEEDGWSVSVVARFRLLDSGKLHGQALEARAAAEELLHRMEDMKRQIGLEVATAAVTLDSAVQRVRVAQDAVVQAEEDYRMALKRYQAQVGTNIDVLDARLALTDAKNALADSVAEARTAYGDLLYAMGDTRL